MKKLLLAIVGLIASCSSPAGYDTAQFNIYDWYANAPEMQYTLPVSDTVALSSQTPLYDFPIPSTWEYYAIIDRWTNKFDIPKNLATVVTLDSSRGDTLLYFTIDTTSVPVKFQDSCYTAFRNSKTGQWDSIKLEKRLPIPHKSEIVNHPDRVPYILVDGSVGFRSDLRIFSSTYGRIAYPGILIRFNGGGCEPIGRWTNEFLAREKWWFR